MTTEARKRKQQAKKIARRVARQYRAEIKGWVRLTMRASCGCCNVQLWYSTLQRAQAAALQAVYRDATITDDKGHRHTVDGFYGVQLDEF